MGVYASVWTWLLCMQLAQQVGVQFHVGSCRYLAQDHNMAAAQREADLVIEMRAWRTPGARVVGHWCFTVWLQI